MAKALVERVLPAWRIGEGVMTTKRKPKRKPRPAGEAPRPAPWNRKFEDHIVKKEVSG